MTARKFFKFGAFVLCSLHLNGCTSVERASLAITPESRIDANIVLKIPNAETLERRSQEEIEQEQQKLERDYDNLRNCVSGSVSRVENSVRISVRNNSVVQFNDVLKCIKINDNYLSEHAAINLFEEDGFFISKQRLVLNLEMPIKNKTLYLPESIVIEMRNITSVVSVNSLAVSTNIENISTNSVLVTFSPIKSVVENWSKSRGAFVEIVSESKKNKYGLGDLLSFFSILFGSGIAVTLGSRVLAVRTERRTGGGSD